MRSSVKFNAYILYLTQRAQYTRNYIDSLKARVYGRSPVPFFTEYRSTTAFKLRSHEELMPRDRTSRNQRFIQIQCKSTNFHGIDLLKSNNIQNSQIRMIYILTIIYRFNRTWLFFFSIVFQTRVNMSLSFWIWFQWTFSVVSFRNEPARFEHITVTIWLSRSVLTKDLEKVSSPVP